MQTIIVLNQPKQKRKSQLTKLIEKYTDRLEILKQNQKEEMELTNMDDARMNAYNDDIRATAAFIRDLKTLKRTKKK